MRKRERDRETSTLLIAFSRTQNVACGTVPVWLTRNVKKKPRTEEIVLGYFEQCGALYIRLGTSQLYKAYVEKLGDGPDQ